MSNGIQFERQVHALRVSNATERTEPELKCIPLETARQKAEQEGNKTIYQGLIEAYSDISQHSPVSFEMESMAA